MIFGTSHLDQQVDDHRNGLLVMIDTLKQDVESKQHMKFTDDLQAAKREHRKYMKLCLEREHELYRQNQLKKTRSR